MYYNNPSAKLVNYKARRTFQMVYIIGMIYFMWQYPIATHGFFGPIVAFGVVIAGMVIDAILMFNKNKGDERRERAWKAQTIKEAKAMLLLILAMAIPTFLLFK